LPAWFVVDLGHSRQRKKTERTNNKPAAQQSMWARTLLRRTAVARAGLVATAASSASAATVAAVAVVVAATTTTAVVSCNGSTTSSDDATHHGQQPLHQQQHRNDVVAASNQPSLLLPSSLPTPSLQATTRALRLFGTCLFMVADYKLDGLYQLMEKQNNNNDDDDDPNASDDDDDEDDDEVEHALRLAAFRRAQEQYTRKDSQHPELSVEERVWVKQEEKKTMQLAAERLAELEQRREEQLHKRPLLLDSSKSTGSSSNDDNDSQAPHHQKPSQQRHRRRRGRGHERQHVIHQRAAQRLLDLCQHNRGVYIKIGQHLANLDYLLPVEYITTLSVLFDDNPVTSYDDVCAVIREDLGQHPNELFASLDTTPLASASLAQVYTAVEKTTGRKLAVKVQHRYLRETAMADVQQLVWAVRWAEYCFADDFTFGWLAQEIAPNVPKELDFCLEGQNAERAARHLKQHAPQLDCVIPKICWDKTSSRVLTMEYEDGVKASDAEGLRAAGLDDDHHRHDLSNLVASVFASQIFDAGFVHCDPHEGNLLFRKSKQTGQAQLVLLDHGLYRELDEPFRRDYACLWKSLLMADIKGIYTACQNLGVRDVMADGDTYRLFAGVLTARPFDEVVERSKQRHGLLPTAQSSAVGSLRRQRRGGGRSSASSDHIMIRGYAQKYLREIIAMLDHIPRPMLMLLKTNDCLRHIDHLLGTPPLHTLLVTGEYATAAVYRSTHHARWLDRFRAWLGYVLVMARVRLQKLALYWINHRWWLAT
jgi:aarF domain-containing kinase